MKAKAYKATGEERSSAVELPEPLFDGTVNEAVLHQVVTARLANRRQGTASTKSYGDISGGGRKPWRQKGTGRARHGTIRSPIWRGGVVTFGPQPRDHGVRVPRKLNRLAIQSALNARALEEMLFVVEPFELEDPSTRTIANMLAAMGLEGRNVLVLTDGLEELVHLSARNIPDVEVRPWGQASAYELLRADALIVVEGAWELEPAAGETSEDEDEEREEDR